MSLMKMVYQAGLNNGLSPNQARAFTAEVGRENDFNPSFIFGEHRDSNRDNVGIISWNQGRRRNLYSYLQKRGISTKNGIERSQRSLDAQMGFAIHEMKTNPDYKATKRIFLDNPNVDYRTAEKVLGKNFIRWDYAGNSLGAKVRAHHNKRDKYYAQLGGVNTGTLTSCSSGSLFHSGGLNPVGCTSLGGLMSPPVCHSGGLNDGATGAPLSVSADCHDGAAKVGLAPLNSVAGLNDGAWNVGCDL